MARSLLLILLALAAAAPARSESLVARVRNAAGEPVRDAVVYVEPVEPLASPPAPETTVIDQIDKEFVPYVTVVPVGTSIRFPNRDGIRHHVYSFSEAKSFEIPLYQGMPPEAIDFHRTGEVVLGCNIHDWMKAYVFVVDTPWFAVSDAGGRARVELPPGRYRAFVWHPRLRGKREDTATPLVVEAGASSEVAFSIEQKQVWNPRRAPSARDPSYR